MNSWKGIRRLVLVIERSERFCNTKTKEEVQKFYITSKTGTNQGIYRSSQSGSKRKRVDSEGDKETKVR